MGRILAFAGSNSNTSINKQLVEHTVDSIGSHEITLLDLNDYVMPIYDIDLEKDSGIPAKALEFKQHIDKADGIIISFAEHNGSYSVAVKNIIDWCSRTEGKLWSEKPMFIMATSPGPRGGASVLSAAVNRIPFNGGKVSAQFSLPRFHEHFDEDKGITNESLHQQHQQALALFLKDV